MSARERERFATSVRAAATALGSHDAAGVPAAKPPNDIQHEPVVCVCTVPIPDHIRLFDAWQCSRCYRKCEPPT